MLDAEEVRTFRAGHCALLRDRDGSCRHGGSPYLCIDKAAVVQDYAGVIGISGNREGKVYFTAPRGMLSVMLMCMNETDTGEQNVRDLVGEVANTISGNARRDFGRNFVISTPTICDRTNAVDRGGDHGPFVRDPDQLAQLRGQRRGLLAVRARRRPGAARGRSELR
jgi:chemotaxis protein CheX